MRNDVDVLAISLRGNVLAKFQSTVFDRGGGRHGGSYDFDAVCAHGVGDAAPVVDAWEEFAGYMELVETEEAVSEDNGILRRFCGGASAVLCFAGMEDERIEIL